MNGQIDAADRASYRRHDARCGAPTVTSQARAGTLNLVPRATGR